MISKKLIKNLKSDIDKRDQARSRILGVVHGLGREAKHVIFILQRDQKKEASRSLKNLEGKLKPIIGQAEKEGLRQEGSLKAVVEEYLEAVYLSRAMENKSLPDKLPFAVSADEQLGALSDLTGELVRAATHEVTKGRYGRIGQYRDATEELYGVLLQMNLTGSLRSKRDAASRNLRRLEEILYDLSLKRR